MSVKLAWKEIYPWIKEAVSRLDSVDALLHETVERLAATYSADCVLVAGFERMEFEHLVCYATSGGRRHLDAIAAPDCPPSDRPPAPTQSLTVQRVQLQTLPVWLSDQQHTPRLLQTEAGDLIVPVLSRGEIPDSGLGSSANPLQLLLWLERSPQHPSPEPSSTLPIAPLDQIWNPDEIESIQVVCSLLGLAYSALYWRQRLEQSRQQAALIGRISRLLNSNLTPHEMVGQIIAELGQGVNCDRCILVDLSRDPGIILTTWDHPDYALASLQEQEVSCDLWQDVVDLFLQGGASYLQVQKTETATDALHVWMGALGAASILVIPLFIQSEFFGVVALLSYQQSRLYPLDELQTVRQVADQAAIALSQAHNYQNVWHRQELLRLQNYPSQRTVMQDDLTHLLNRRSLERELEQLSTSAIWSVHDPFTIVMCDLDYFKLVNDTYGHGVGDEVLRILAGRLQKQLRKDTPLYRYGGEEFATVLMGAELNQAVDVAERLRYAIQSEPIVTSAGDLRITASFGVAQRRPTEDPNAWAVVQRADQALHEAKRQGRDRVKAI